MSKPSEEDTTNLALPVDRRSSRPYNNKVVWFNQREKKFIGIVGRRGVYSGDNFRVQQNRG